MYHLNLPAGELARRSQETTVVIRRDQAPWGLEVAKVVETCAMSRLWAERLLLAALRYQAGQLRLDQLTDVVFRTAKALRRSQYSIACWALEALAERLDNE